MKNMNKLVYGLPLIILDTAELAATIQLSRLSIPKLLRWIKLCTCDGAVALVDIFLQTFEKRKSNQSFVFIYVTAECPNLREMVTEQNQQIVCAALSAHLLRGIERRFDHILHPVLVDSCSSLNQRRHIPPAGAQLIQQLKRRTSWVRFIKHR